MSKKLYVGNLPYSVGSSQLEEMGKPFGELVSAKVIEDKFSGRSKGFGFLEYVNAEDADKAIESLNNKEMEGRNIVVNEARPMAPRTGGGFGYRGDRGDRGGRGGFGGGGGGGGGRGGRDRGGRGGSGPRW